MAAIETPPIPLRQALAERVLIQDGAKGTALFAAGLPQGASPDSWNLLRPEVVEAIHREYVAAGADILVTNTFGALRPTLEPFGLEDRLAEINRRAVELARRAAAGRAYVSASIPPLGHLMRPIGPLGFEQVLFAYREQVEALEEVGVDAFHVETASDLRSVKAAFLAIRAVSRKPIVAMMTFGDGDRTLQGTSPQAAAIALEAMGADVIGANCSTGPAEILRVLQAMREVTARPLVAQPNAGLPLERDGLLIYPESPECFAGYVERLLQLGVGILGGCCGTTPDHIRALRARLGALGARGRPAFAKPAPGITWLAGRSAHLGIGPGRPLAVFGERLNPTRRERLRTALSRGELGPLREEGRRQTAAGALALDVNVGAGAAESEELMAAAVAALDRDLGVPLAIDSADPKVLAAGLRCATGRPLLNSVSARPAQLDELLPIAAAQGAAVVGLCLEESGIPKTVSGRLQAAERILRAAERHGLSSADVLIDPGVVPAAVAPDGPAQVLQVLSALRERLGVNTIIGLSNVSHGLPGREALNAAFLAMAVRAGLDAALLDPLQAAVLESAGAAERLCDRTPVVRGPGAAVGWEAPVEESLAEAILWGDTGAVLSAVERSLTAGREPRSLVDGVLLPALAELGRRFQLHQVFLPQVMAVAEAAGALLDRLEPLLLAGGQPSGPRVVFATVEGDVHDIGKNIVAALLRAAGFRVIDLGKNVKAATIADAAEHERAQLVCLSALMTTTMRRMGEVIALARRRGVTVPFLVGGAVVTEGFAKSLGAAWAADALGAVDVARRLTATV